MNSRYVIDNLCEYQLRDNSDVFSIRRHNNMNGESLIGQTVGRYLLIGGSRIVENDMIATNGIVHILEKPIIRRRLSWKLLPDTSFIFDIFN